MTTPVFGELTRSATRHLHAAAGHIPDPGSLPAEIAQAQRATRALRRYLDDIISASGIRPFMTAHDPGFDATLHARQALRNAAAHLTAARRCFPPAATDLLPAPAAGDPDDPAAGHLAGAAVRLTAGRDLLRTHFHHQRRRRSHLRVPMVGRRDVAGRDRRAHRRNHQPLRAARALHPQSRRRRGRPRHARRGTVRARHRPVPARYGREDPAFRTAPRPGHRDRAHAPARHPGPPAT
jgi:hypothetical protein